MAARDARGQFLKWLGIVCGVLAILTFLGFANYRQLAAAVGWHSSSTHSTVGDAADAGLCATIQVDLTRANTNVPADGDSKVGFYGDQATAFSDLYASSNSALQHHIDAVSNNFSDLDQDWVTVAEIGSGNEQQIIARTMTSLSRNEQSLESWCLTHTGVS